MRRIRGHEVTFRWSFLRRREPIRRRDAAATAEAADASAAAFFSCRGVTQYLTSDTVLSTLKLIASRCMANGVVLDFPVPRSAPDAFNQAAFDALVFRVSATGEPLQTFLSPGELAYELKGMGYCHIEDLCSSQINSYYFKNRNDDSCVCGRLAAWLVPGADKLLTLFLIFARRIRFSLRSRHVMPSCRKR
jgi:hypothetical protein